MSHSLLAVNTSSMTADLIRVSHSKTGKTLGHIERGRVFSLARYFGIPLVFEYVPNTSEESSELVGEVQVHLSDLPKMSPALQAHPHPVILDPDSQESNA